METPTENAPLPQPNVAETSAPEQAVPPAVVAEVQFLAHLPVYQGPLEVLLSLIEEHELEITKVALAQVTSQFIAYIGAMDKREPQMISNFLQIAAKLILIKSRSLLPRVQVEAEVEEETDDLVAALKAYQLYKRAARILAEREKTGLRSFRVEPPQISRPKSTSLPLDNVTVDLLARAMQRVVDRWLPPPDVGNVMSRLPFTVNDCMDRIRASVKAKPRVLFTDMLVGINTRVEIVVTLLALLELLKRFAVRAYQDKAFGEIWFEYFPEAERPWAEMGMTPPAEDDNTVEFAV